MHTSWPIIGHEWAVQQLQVAAAREELSHALLITGPANVGKQTLALTLAKALLCQDTNPERRPCATCSACRRVDSGNHPDLLLVEPEVEGRGVKIEQVRELERFLALTPHESRCKIAIVTAFELIVPNAANALLKTLEEPPAYAHLILLASDADQLLPTIVSRSQQIALRALDRKTIAQALVEHWHASEAQAQQLARLSGGRLGWAVQAITKPEQLQDMEEALDTLFTIAQSDLLTRFDIAQQLSRDAVRLAQTLEYWRMGWHDVVLLQTGNGKAVTFQERLPQWEAWATKYDLATSARILRLLTEALNNLQKNVNTRLLAEALLLDLPEE